LSLDHLPTEAGRPFPASNQRTSLENDAIFNVGWRFFLKIDISINSRIQKPVLRGPLDIAARVAIVVPYAEVRGVNSPTTG